MPATSSQKTVDVKEAANIATEYLRKLIKFIPAGDIGLEEAELSGDIWGITLSFTDRRNTGLSSVLTGEGRVYKKFGVDKSTGEVLFMRIRKP